MVCHRIFHNWIFVYFAIGALAAGCSTPEKKGSRPVEFAGGEGRGNGGKTVVTQVGLQESLQRFCGSFTERMGQAGTELYKSSDPQIRKAAMRQVLLYQSSALDITTEPEPEVALLDMLVFMTLSKDSFQNYWRPKVFGAAGDGLGQALQQSESELWALAGRVMSPAQQNTMKKLIRDWQSKNPGQYKVEGVRLTSLAQHAGAVTGKGGDASGVLAGVSSAVERMDEALLMANRGFFLAQRMPFLLRLQARLLTSEILDDLSASALMVQSGGVAQKAGVAAQEGKTLVQSLYPLIPGPGMLARYLGDTERITDKTLALVSALERAETTSRIEGLARNLMVDFFLLMVALSVVVWGGLFSFRRALARAGARDRHKEEAPRSRDKAA